MGQIVNILGFEGHKSSVISTHCCHSTKVAIDNMQIDEMNRLDCVPIKLNLQK